MGTPRVRVEIGFFEVNPWTPPCVRELAAVTIFEFMNTVVNQYPLGMNTSVLPYRRQCSWIRYLEVFLANCV